MDDYQVVGGLTDQEAFDLNEFLGSRMDTNTLYHLVERNSVCVDASYRGIKYRKEDLVVGNVYKHWYGLSSWSTDKSVAVSFALDGYVPEGVIDDLLVDKGHNPRELDDDSSRWDEAYAEISNVVFVATGSKGFLVNDHLLHKYFSSESELICCRGMWIIKSIGDTIQTEKGSYVEVCVELD